MSNDEITTIQRAQKGDPLAFARLHDRYFPIIYRFYFYRIGDENLIGELTAGLFNRMVERLSTYKAESMKFLPWLYMLAKSLMMETLLERGLTYEQALPSLPIFHVTPPFTPSQMKSVLSQLTGDERDVVIGKVIERRSVRDVAREVRRTTAMVRVLQRQGLKTLHQILSTGCES